MWRWCWGFDSGDGEGGDRRVWERQSQWDFRGAMANGLRSVCLMYYCGGAQGPKEVVSWD